MKLRKDRLTIQRMVDTQTFIQLSLKDLKYPSSHYCPAVVLKATDNRIPVSLWESPGKIWGHFGSQGHCQPSCWPILQGCNEGIYNFCQAYIHG